MLANTGSCSTCSLKSLFLCVFTTWFLKPEKPCCCSRRRPTRRHPRPRTTRCARASFFSISYIHSSHTRHSHSWTDAAYISCLFPLSYNQIPRLVRAYYAKDHEPSCTTRLRIGPWHGGSETSGGGGGLRAAASRSAAAGAKACRSEGMRRRQLHCAGRGQVRERQ